MSANISTSSDFLALWPHINQLESVLEVMNDDFCAMLQSEDAAQRRHLRDRVHNLLGAAQTIAGELAKATSIR